MSKELSAASQIEQAIKKVDPGMFGEVDNRSAKSAIIKALSGNTTPRTADDWKNLGYSPSGRNGLDNEELRRLNSAMATCEGLRENLQKAKTAIKNDTQTKTFSLSKLFTSRKAVNNEAVWQQALTSIGEGNKFRYINDQIAKAVIKDLEGPIVEGGLIGGAYSIIKPNTHLAQAIDNIATKYWQPEADRIRDIVLPKLASQLEIAHILASEDISQAEKLGTHFASIFGARSSKYMVNYWRTNSDFRKYAHNKIKRGLIDVWLATLGAVMSGTIYGGMIKIPWITIQRKWTFTQDALASAMSDGKKNATDYLQTPLNDSGSFISRTLRAQQAPNEGTKNTAKQISIQLANGIVVNVGGLIDKLNQSENRFRNFFDKLTLGLTDDEKWLEKKLVEYGTLMQKTTVLTSAEVERAYKLHWDIASMLQTWADREERRTGKRKFNADVSLQALSDTKQATQLTASAESLSRWAKFETFLNKNKNRLEKMAPNKPEYIKTYNALLAYKKWDTYDGKNGIELAQYIWDSPDIPGAQTMFKAYNYGPGGAVASYEKQYRNQPAQTLISTEKDKYGGDISSILHDGNAVSDYLATHTNKKNNQNIAARYATVLETLWGKYEFSVLSTDIIECAKKGKYNTNFVGQNTGMSTRQIKEGGAQWYPALVFQVPATIDGMTGWLEVWVKGDCANLVIGKFSQTRNTGNSEALISLRAPLLYSIRRASGEGKQEAKTKDCEPGQEPGKKGGGSSGGGGGGRSSGSSAPEGQNKSGTYTANDQAQKQTATNTHETTPVKDPNG